MDPIKFESMNKTFAEDQPQYIPLPVFQDPDGRVTSVWKPTDEEKKIIAEGGMICLCQSTFNQPLQPVNLWAADVKEIE